MRRNPPSYRLFKRNELEKFLVLMESPITDNVFVPQLAGVTTEAHSWLVLSDAKCGLSTAQTLHSTLQRVKPVRVGKWCLALSKREAEKDLDLWARRLPVWSI